MNLVMDDFDEIETTRLTFGNGSKQSNQYHKSKQRTAQQDLHRQGEQKQQILQPKLATFTNGKQIDGRAAVLEMAKLYLDPVEFESIQEALEKCAMNRSVSSLREYVVDDAGPKTALSREGIADSTEIDFDRRNISGSSPPAISVERDAGMFTSIIMVLQVLHVPRVP
jgi:hypothetical protein